jgi:hypothetical protein
MEYDCGWCIFGTRRAENRKEPNGKKDPRLNQISKTVSATNHQKQNGKHDMRVNTDRHWLPLKDLLSTSTHWLKGFIPKTPKRIYTFVYRDRGGGEL